MLDVCEGEILRLMRIWLSEDAASRVWLSGLHARGENYARAQLWQVRKELAYRLRSELLAKEPDERPLHARFDTGVLLRLVLHASGRLASRSGDNTWAPAEAPAEAPAARPATDRRTSRGGTA